MSQALEVSTLDTLAGEINAEVRAIGSLAAEATRHARLAGERLIEAKALVPHGEFKAWIAENFEDSYRTARLYMKIADRWPELEAKWQRVATLSIREADKLLSTPHDREEPTNSEEVRMENGPATRPPGLRTENLISRVREGMALGIPNTEAAKRVGISNSTYGKAQHIVRLAEDDILPIEARKTVDAAIELMDETGQVQAAYESVGPIMERRYGPSASRGDPESTAARHLADFEHAYNALTATCRASTHIPIPYLLADRTREVTNGLDEAARAIRDLKMRITQ